MGGDDEVEGGFVGTCGEPPEGRSLFGLVEELKKRERAECRARSTEFERAWRIGTLS